MLAISTAWMGGAEKGIEHWLTRIKDLGFDAVELSYKITQAQLEEMEELLSKMDIKVSSVHNFCPQPDDEPSPRHLSNYYRLSSIDERERQQAVEWTKITVDTAKRNKANVAVIHAGTMDFEDERSPYLFELYVNGKKDTEVFKEEKARILTLRAEKKGPHIEALERSFKELTDHARTRQVKIGLETRYYPIEIPDFEEIGYFLNMFDETVMGYWHDFGHAEMNGRLGIRAHKEFLDTYKDRLIGVHIHGMKGRRDHLAPFEGDMDFDQFSTYLKPHVIKVVESKPFASEDLMKEAARKLM